MKRCAMAWVGTRRRVVLAPRSTWIKRDCGGSKMVDSSNDYNVVISRRHEQPERWSWEIVRKSKPLGVRLTADGFQSEGAAQFAGRRALEDVLIQLSSFCRETHDSL